MPSSDLGTRTDVCLKDPPQLLDAGSGHVSPFVLAKSFSD
jgi:hypothetical protein